MQLNLLLLGLILVTINNYHFVRTPSSALNISKLKKHKLLENS